MRHVSFGAGAYDRRVLSRAWRRVAAFTVIAVLGSAPVAAADPIADSIVAADAVARVGDRFIGRSAFDRWFRRRGVEQPRDQPFRERLRPAGLRRLREDQAQDGAEARQGPARDDRRAVQGAVPAGVRGPARPGSAVPHPRELGRPGDARARHRAAGRRSSKPTFQKAKHDTFPKESDFRRFLEDLRHDGRRRALSGRVQHALHEAARGRHRAGGARDPRGRRDVLPRAQAAVLRAAAA